MKEITGDLWELQPNYDAIVITTNGFVKNNGDAVMGRGVALQAKEKYPELPERLGRMLKYRGNKTSIFFFGDDAIFTLPVKSHWRELANINLILRSIEGLVTMVTNLGYKNVLLPRPGCGNGGLDWEMVKPVIEPLLDDRFTVVYNMRPETFRSSDLAKWPMMC